MSVWSIEAMAYVPGHPTTWPPKTSAFQKGMYLPLLMLGVLLFFAALFNLHFMVCWTLDVTDSLSVTPFLLQPLKTLHYWCLSRFRSSPFYAGTKKHRLSDQRLLASLPFGHPAPSSRPRGSRQEVALETSNYSRQLEDMFEPTSLANYEMG